MPRKQRGAHAPMESPRLPSRGLDVETMPPPLADGTSYSQVVVSHAELHDQVADDVLFEQVLFRRVNLMQTNLSRAQMLDVRFETCDLVGAEWEKVHLNRVECIGSRLMGLKLIKAEIENVFVKDCNAEFAIFWDAVFKGVRFEHCILGETSFERADLSGVVFHDCDLRKADLRGAKLVGTDFRGSRIDGLQVGLKELRGAIVDPSQTLYLAALLGITVKNTDE